VNEPKSNNPGTNAGSHYPCIFQNLCVKGAMYSCHSILNFFTNIHMYSTVFFLLTVVCC